MAELALEIKSLNYKIALKNTRLTIGRLPTSDVTIDDPMASGKHCTLTNGVLLDTGSTNGTWLNGERLRYGVKTPMKLGDRIQLGHLQGRHVLNIVTRTVRSNPNTISGSGTIVASQLSETKAAATSLNKPPSLTKISSESSSEEVHVIGGEGLALDDKASSSSSSSSSSDDDDGNDEVNVTFPAGESLSSSIVDADPLDWMPDLTSSLSGSNKSTASESLRASVAPSESAEHKQKMAENAKLRAELHELQSTLTKIEAENKRLKKIAAEQKSSMDVQKKEMERQALALESLDFQLLFGLQHVRMQLEESRSCNSKLEAQLTQVTRSIEETQQAIHLEQKKTQEQALANLALEEKLAHQTTLHSSVLLAVQSKQEEKFFASFQAAVSSVQSEATADGKNSIEELQNHTQVIYSSSKKVTARIQALIGVLILSTAVLCSNFL
jgi:hypothetical protein